MFVKAKATGSRRVTYWDGAGSSTTYVGGNRTWRNQNPGNIGAGAWANSHGAIGSAGGFAVFPDYDIGRAAIFALLKSPKYVDLSIWDAIPKYSPAKDNDIAWYRRIVKRASGLDIKRKIKDLSAAELDRYVDAIERAEGRFRAGRIVKEASPRGKKKITAVKKNKKGTIVRYYIEDFGWVPKRKAIDLASSGVVDAVVATSRSGSLYLRSRPNGQALENMG